MSVSVMNPELELLELDDEDDALDRASIVELDVRMPAGPLLDCCPTMPLMDATVPATGARRVVSSSFFCALATCCSADVTAASVLRELLGLRRLLLDRDAHDRRVVLILRGGELRLRVLDALRVLELAVALVQLGRRQTLLRGGLLALRLRQARLRGVRRSA